MWPRERQGCGTVTLTLFFSPFTLIFPSSTAYGQANRRQVQHNLPPHDRGCAGRPEVPGPGRVSPHGSQTARPLWAAVAPSPPLSPGGCGDPRPSPRPHCWGDTGDGSSAQPLQAALWGRRHAFKPRTAELRGSTAKPLRPDCAVPQAAAQPHDRAQYRPYALPRGTGTKATVPPALGGAVTKHCSPHGANRPSLARRLSL